MKQETLCVVVRKCKETKNIVIVGAGVSGKELYGILKQHGQAVKEFFDNNEKKIGTRIEDVEIKRPYKLFDGKSLYIISVRNLLAKQEFFCQLIQLGIDEDNIILYNDLSDPEYIKELDEKEYPNIINSMYLKKFGREINFDNPMTYNEKISLDKIYLKDPIRTRLADKVEVRGWIKEQIGEKYLTKWYAVWDNTEDIDFEKLPQSFVLKLNNGSDRNILVKDKSKLDIPSAIGMLNDWKKANYAYFAMELQYKNIVPKIICEEYLKDLAETVYDYNIYCFHGKPEYIWCIKGSHRPNCKASFYNLDWEMQPFSYGYPKDEELAPRPEKLEEMLKLSEILCKQFKHVRVDWYSMPDGRLLFGEMTFTSWAGLSKFIPDEYDLELGKLI